VQRAVSAEGEATESGRGVASGPLDGIPIVGRATR